MRQENIEHFISAFLDFCQTEINWFDIDVKRKCTITFAVQGCILFTLELPNLFLGKIRIYFAPSLIFQPQGAADIEVYM